MEQNVRKRQSNAKKVIYRQRDGIEGQERVVGSKRWKVRDL